MPDSRQVAIRIRRLPVEALWPAACPLEDEGDESGLDGSGTEVADIRTQTEKKEPERQARQRYDAPHTASPAFSLPTFALKPRNSVKSMAEEPSLRSHNDPIGTAGRVVCIGSLPLSPFPLLLAPMEDVSDPPFRAVCKKGGADLMYTEFISSEGLVRDALKSRQKLDLYEEERPMGIQIFGGELDPMLGAVDKVAAVGPDLIDLNFGCPVKNVVCKDAGSGMLRNLPKLILITKELVKRSPVPLTVKTRLGWDEQSKHIVYLAEALQDVGVAALAIHGRTRVQMYKGQADWTLIGEVKANPRMRIPVFGNGDVDSPARAAECAARYGVDGIMIGRAAIGNPWIFREIKHYMQFGQVLPPPTVAERLAACREHLHLSIAWKGPKLGILEMRRHYAPYFKGFEHIKEIRSQLVRAEAVHEVDALLDQIQERYAPQISLQAATPC